MAYYRVIGKPVERVDGPEMLTAPGYVKSRRLPVESLRTNG